MESILNLDLLWVGIVVAGAGTLGFSIYFSNQKSATSRAFLFFAIASIFWSITNFASARVTDPTAVLWFIRFVLFFAIWHAFSFFVLARQFPASEPKLEKRAFLQLLSWTAFISIVVLTPVVYEAVTAVSPSIETQTGPGIVLFGFTVFGFIGYGIWALGRKFLRSGGAERNQMGFVFIGMVMTFVFLIVFDFIFPAFLNIPTLVPFGGLFLLPFIGGTAYAILQYRLFNPRVAFFGVLTFVLATATFFDVLLSVSLAQVLYRVAELVLILLAGVWLIKSMVREFELKRELQETNERQEGLIHFIGHEVKGFLTKDAGTFAALLDGDFGTLPATAKPLVEHALVESRQGESSVATILKAANLKKGTVTYTKERFDLKALVAETVEKAKITAEQKELTLSFSADDASYLMMGDKGEINDHVLRNLIDNSINYTPSGSIAVSLKRQGTRIIFTVKDTGIGITEEDKIHLFTEGGHGKNSQKVNVHSTGYGLFIAKQITEAHGGTIRAESEGAGKGSAFIVEFPV